MNTTLRSLFILSLGSALLLAPLARAEEDPLNDPDLQEMLKEAQEMQKQTGKAPVKMSDLQKQADAALAEQKQEELKERAALEKQLAAPGPVAFPDWTPATPQLKVNGPPGKKILDDAVQIFQMGTSPLTPKELGDAWEKAVAEKPLNHGRNNSLINGAPSVMIYLSTRTEPQVEVRMEASREADGKITEVTITSPLPKPEGD